MKIKKITIKEKTPEKTKEEQKGKNKIKVQSKKVSVFFRIFKNELNNKGWPAIDMPPYGQKGSTAKIVAIKLEKNLFLKFVIK